MRITSSAETVTVHVSILPNGSQKFQLDVDNITVTNLGTNLSVSYDQTQIPVRIMASDANLKSFDPSPDQGEHRPQRKRRRGLRGSASDTAAG